MSAQKGIAQTTIIIATIVVALIGLFAYSKGLLKVPAQISQPTTPATPATPLASASSSQLTLPAVEKQNTSSSAKGVVIVQSPKNGQEIKSPLTVTGFVYGNNGTLTIKLKQKESGQYVTQDKVVKIEGKSDQISFAEAIQFGLPAMPQSGVLEIGYKDKSGKGLDDRVEIEVEFPSDLGKGT